MFGNMFESNFITTGDTAVKLLMLSWCAWWHESWTICCTTLPQHADTTLVVIHWLTPKFNGLIYDTLGMSKTSGAKKWSELPGWQHKNNLDGCLGCHNLSPPHVGISRIHWERPILWCRSGIFFAAPVLRISSLKHPPASPLNRLGTRLMGCNIWEAIYWHVILCDTSREEMESGSMLAIVCVKTLTGSLAALPHDIDLILVLSFHVAGF